MSVTVEYSFNSELPLPELAFEIRRRLGCVLRPGSEDPEALFSGGLFGMELDLWVHTLVNDRDANFESYRYLLGNKTWAGNSMRRIQMEVMALIAYFLHDTLEIDRGMLTYDVQIVVARYEPRAEGWHDLVGDKRVTYPEHLIDLKARVDDPAGSGLVL